MIESRARVTSTLRLQIQHSYQPQSNPYQPQEVEDALSALKAAGLQERGGGASDAPGVIRHETGPEILLFLGALAELSAAIIHLVKASRKHRPETVVNVTISDVSQLEEVLKTLAGSAKPC